MQIGQLAKKAGVNPRTIRFYEQIGVLPAPRRTPSGYRQYTDRDFDRLAFIRNVKALGVALGEIKEVLAFRDRGASPCPYVLSLIDSKAHEIRARIRGLQTLARQLRQLRRAAAAIPSRKVAAKAHFCHILENRKILAARATH
jgi:MerR family transcriptional regulator, copper efflux regulator